MTTATISTKGWVVIPAEMRRKYHLHSGAQVHVVDYGGVLALVPALEEPVRDALGMFEGARLTEALLEEHALERTREQ